VRISSHATSVILSSAFLLENLIILYISFSIFSEYLFKKQKNTLPDANGTPSRREFIFIPPLRGDSGGCAFFVYPFFTNIGIFRIEMI